MQFARYELIEPIDVSGRGELWLAEQRGASGFVRKVVVARLGADASSNPAAVEAFINSTKSAALIDHAHVAKVFDIGCEDGRFFYSRTWVDGVSVQQLLATLAEKRQTLPVEHALFITRRVADAISAAHHPRTGLIHGSLSSNRVMVSRYGEVVVTGFTGEAIFDDASGPAPEQATDERSDVYAVGALLFELIAGVPATACGARPLLSSIDPSVPARLDELVARALSVDPEDRYGDINSLLFVLREIGGALDNKSSAYSLGTWMAQTLDDKKPPRKTARPAQLMKPIPATVRTPLSEFIDQSVDAIAAARPTRAPTAAEPVELETTRLARGSIAPPASYAQIPVVVRTQPPQRSTGWASLRQLLFLLAIAALLFAASTSITMAVQ